MTRKTETPPPETTPEPTPEVPKTEEKPTVPMSEAEASRRRRWLRHMESTFIEFE